MQARQHSDYSTAPGSSGMVIPEKISLVPQAGGRSIDAAALEIGDIIVLTTDVVISGLIVDTGGSQESYAVLYVGDGIVIAAAGGGVTLTTLEHAFEDNSFAVALRYPGLTEDQKLIIRGFAGQHLDSGYDYVSIAKPTLYRLAGEICDQLEGFSQAVCEASRYQVNFGNDDADRWYCSELVFAAYEHAGAHLAILPHTSAPSSLVSLTKTLEYVGHLEGYPSENGGLQTSGSKSLGGNLPRARHQQTVEFIGGHNQSQFGLVGNDVLVPMTASRSRMDQFCGIPIHSISGQKMLGSSGFNPQNHPAQRQFLGAQSQQQTQVVPINQATDGFSWQYCAEDYVHQEDAGPSWAVQDVHERTGVRALDLNLVSITHAGSYRLAYDRFKRLGYGVIQPLPARDNRRFRGTASLQDALNAWAEYIPTVMTVPNYILTGGAYVDKTGEHGRGNAIDIDGFWWSETDKFLANDAPTDWYRYLTIEATLRKAFGTVLNYDYNRAHHDHWHCELGYNTSWRRVSSQSYFAQRALNEIWGEDLSVDGDWGNLSNAAASRNGYDFTITGAWDHFLDNIINQQSTTLANQNRNQWKNQGNDGFPYRSHGS